MNEEAKEGHGMMDLSIVNPAGIGGEGIYICPFVRPGIVPELP